MEKKLGIQKLEHLAARLNLPLREILAVSNKIESHYRRSPKRIKDKLREIDKPSKRLSKILKRLNKLLEALPVSQYAYGYVKGYNTVSLADKHCKAKYLHLLDIKDFYPNIGHRRVYRLFQDGLGCSPEVSRVLTRLTTCRGCLPQGFNSSPAISNLILARLDDRIGNICKNYNVTYGRYADDLSFSGNAIPEIFLERVKQAVCNSGFTLNDQKEEHCDGQTSKTVLGLNVAGARPKVFRSYKRNLRAERHQLLSDPNRLTKEDLMKKIQSIEGRRSYIMMVTNAGLKK